ncbi:hypothetical protein SAMD00019534_004890 [Acytostelium subglobosum LB1]|uniref:hypothetical protein n=1 Tax=Acytostelium subglobosum LB1 TaxID=1410327 RepID=UPI000644ABE7|nr:hypothetical protein SAMD00019534_004890 [Acytostelium subglobosum LB1]GAM17314.1 hypothetical protein SAMD00019534_004890 [Acytostelium subglobosum LB1]|eukprot:XP_012759376.1 hypothetical protein SAMD00019534_004890 [Acytostelium subglobosum LB1]
MFHIKVVVVGDGAIGKTSMLISFASGGFPRDYQPTVFDNFSTHKMYDGKAFKLGLWDTAGQEDFDRLRFHGYVSTDIFLMCYSVVNPPSYLNVFDKWLPEINHYTKNVPIVLVGTQTDLREDAEVLKSLEEKEMKPITYEEGLVMMRKIGARAFSECSVQTMKGVPQVFEEAIRIYIETMSEGKGKVKDKERRKGDKNCVLL